MTLECRNELLLLGGCIWVPGAAANSYNHFVTFRTGSLFAVTILGKQALGKLLKKPLTAKWSSNLGACLLAPTAITSYFSSSLILVTKTFMGFIC